MLVGVVVVDAAVVVAVVLVAVCCGCLLSYSADDATAVMVREGE